MNTVTAEMMDAIKDYADLLDRLEKLAEIWKELAGFGDAAYQECADDLIRVIHGDNGMSPTRQ